MPRDTSIAKAVSVDEAIAIVCSDSRLGPLEHRPVFEALDCVLGETYRASWSMPGHDVSIMDGYALRCADLAHDAPLTVVGESAAGHPATTELRPGTTMRISTGAVVPAGADTVVAQEDVHRDGDRIVVDAATRAHYGRGRFVRPAGSDVTRGTVLLEPGATIGPGEAALLAGCGHPRVSVHARPRVAILSTGDELVPIGTTPRSGQVINTNAAMLAAQVGQAGGIAVVEDIAADDIVALEAAMARALACDLLITSGGISVGDHDHVYATLVKLGFEPQFDAVRLRPGKPTSFGRVGSTAVLALPGNPASSYVTFELFARPWIRRRLGRPPSDWSRPRREVVLTHATEAGGRRAHFVRARVSGERATPLPDQTSGALRSIAGHNALIDIPEGSTRAAAGDRFEALLLDDAACRSPSDDSE